MGEEGFRDALLDERELQPDHSVWPDGQLGRDLAVISSSVL